MSLQSMVPMLRRAQTEGYAVGLFDAHNLEGILAILEAATEQRSPVIIAPFWVPRRAAVALIRELAVDAPVPVAIELDQAVDANGQLTGPAVSLWALLTRKSIQQMGWAPGQPCVIGFKAMAVAVSPWR